MKRYRVKKINEESPLLTHSANGPYQLTAPLSQRGLWQSHCSCGFFTPAFASADDAARVIIAHLQAVRAQ